MRGGARSEESLRLRRAYQRALRRTRRSYIRRRSVALAIQFRAEPRKFWTCFSSRGSQAPPIDAEHMTEHFRQLFEQPRDAAAAESADQVSAALSHRSAADSSVLDSPFTAAELAAGIRCLQRCKEGRKEDLHVCPGKASWLMQGLQRERHAQNKSKPKQRHKTPNSIM